MRLRFEGTVDEWNALFARSNTIICGDNDVSGVRGVEPLPWLDPEPDQPHCTREQCYCNSYEGCSDCVIGLEPEPVPAPVPPAPVPAPVTPIPTPVTPIGPYGKAPQETPPPELTLTVSAEKRQASWEAFCGLVKLWMHNFESEPELKLEQPDRVQAMKDFGSGPHTVAVLVMAYELRSLQKLIWLALRAQGYVELATLPQLADRVAAHMLQISHVGLPDLAGTYDYGSKWAKTCI